MDNHYNLHNGLQVLKISSDCLNYFHSYPGNPGMHQNEQWGLAKPSKA
jgi:hypothetical protein